MGAGRAAAVIACSPDTPCARPRHPRTASVVPSAMRVPKSRTYRRLVTERTSSTSCSTRRTATCPLLADLGEDVAHRRRLVTVEPAGGLVQEQESRLDHQGPAELDEPGPAEAQGLHGSIGQGGQPEQLEDLADPRPLVGGGAALAPQVPPESAGAVPGPLGHQEVVPDGRAGEQLDALEGAADPQTGPRVDPAADQVLAAERDPAGVGAQIAVDAVEQGGLAGAVGPDEADDLPLVHPQGRPVEGGDPGEALGDGLGLEQGAHGMASTFAGATSSDSSGRSSPGSERRRIRRLTKARDLAVWYSMIPSGCLA